MLRKREWTLAAGRRADMGNLLCLHVSDEVLGLLFSFSIFSQPVLSDTCHTLAQMESFPQEDPNQEQWAVRIWCQAQKCWDATAPVPDIWYMANFNNAIAHLQQMSPGGAAILLVREGEKG